LRQLKIEKIKLNKRIFNRKERIYSEWCRQANQETVVGTLEETTMMSFDSEIQNAYV